MMTKIKNKTKLCFTFHKINTDKQTDREPKHQQKEKATAVHCTRTNKMQAYTRTSQL